MEKARRPFIEKILSLTRAVAPCASPLVTQPLICSIVAIDVSIRGWYRSNERRAATNVWSARLSVERRKSVATAGIMERATRRENWGPAFMYTCWSWFTCWVHDVFDDGRPAACVKEPCDSIRTRDTPLQLLMKAILSLSFFSVSVSFGFHACQCVVLSCSKGRLNKRKCITINCSVPVIGNTEVALKCRRLSKSWGHTNLCLMVFSC